MNARTNPEEAVGGLSNHRQKLMVNGFLLFDRPTSQPVEIVRGMAILSKEGDEVGKVAALVFDNNQRRATHLLLSRLPEVGGYWQVSIDLIAEVRAEEVWLSISAQAVEALPRWHSD